MGTTYPADWLAIAPEERERIRCALLELRRERKPVTVRALRLLARAKQNRVACALRHYRDNRLPPLEQRWDVLAGAPASPPRTEAQEAPRAATASQAVPAGSGLGAVAGLAQQVRAARTLEALAELANEIGAKLADGELDYARARAMRDLLQEQRIGLAEAAKRVDGALEEELLPCTQEGAQLVLAFEAIETESTRAELLELVRGRLEAEREQRRGSEAVGAGAEEAGPGAG